MACAHNLIDTPGCRRSASLFSTCILKTKNFHEVHFKLKFSRLVNSRVKGKLAQNAGWLSLGQGLGIISQGFYFVLLGKLLGAMQYGIFAGAFALTAMISQYSSVGTGTLFIRYVSGKPSRFSVYWGNILLVTSLVGGALVVALGILGEHVLSHASASLVVVAALSNCLFGQITTECSRVFQAFERMKFTAVLTLLTNVVRVMAAGIMVLTIRHATASQWATVAMAVSGTAAIASVTLVTIKFGCPRIDVCVTVNHGAEGFGYAFAMSSSSVYNDIDKVMLSHYGMTSANGTYSMAYRILDAACIPLSALREAVLPRLFNTGRYGIAGVSGIALGILKKALPIAALSGAIMFVAAPLVPHLIGKGFSETVPAIQWLCLIPLFRSVHQMSGAALTGAGRQIHRTCAQVSVALLNLLLNLWLIPQYSWRGAATASLVSDGLLAVACWTLLSRALSNAKKRKEIDNHVRIHVGC